MNWSQVRGWFSLNRKEQLILAGLLSIFLVGLAARYIYLRGQNAEPVAVERIEPAR